MLDRLLNFIGKTAVYEAERGTSGIWTYIKYSDGTAKMFANFIKTIGYTRDRGNGVWTADGLVETFPFTFKTPPHCSITSNPYNIGFVAYTIPAKDKVTYCLSNNAAVASHDCLISIEVDGFWK